MPTTYVANGSGVFQPATDIYVADATGATGAWKKTSAVYVADATGAWKKVHPNMDVFNLVIAANTNNYNIRNALVSNGWDQVAPVNVTVTINNGVVVGSDSTSTPALSTGNLWPVGTLLTIINNGIIAGAGGAGGNGSGWQQPGFNGQPGGTAIQLLHSASITNNGTIGGGGGGGGGSDGTSSADHMYGVYGAGGGGGAGAIPGSGGVNAGASAGISLGANPSAGTLLTGGAGGIGASGAGVTAANGGAGGNLGQPGATGGDSPAHGLGPNYAGGAGGAAGKYIDGNSLAVWTVPGTRLGLSA